MATVGARLTDKQKKRILADYVSLGSFNAVAKIHGVARSTVKRIVDENPAVERKLQEKREQNTADILEFMESRKQKIMENLDLLLDAIPGKIEKASLIQITTAYGTLVDKAMGLADNHKKDEGVKVIIDVGSKTE